MMLTDSTTTTRGSTATQAVEHTRGRRPRQVLLASAGLALLLAALATAIALSTQKSRSRLLATDIVVPWLALALVSLLGVLLVALYARSLADRSRLAELSRTMEQTTRTDSLTGLHNRRGLSGHLTRATAHARRRGEPVSVLMIDLYRFRYTNERFGQEAGDEVLCAVADCMRDVLRSDDVYGRWGGDEFLVVLPGTNLRQARFVAERLRTSAGAVDLSDIGLHEGVAMSVGVATAVQTHPDELVRAADVALYRAKATGRVELEEPGKALLAPKPS
jgi:diguanylate cyclase (GGDEF)-like protein